MPIAPKVVGGDAMPTVNGRDLHAALTVGRDFSTWITGRIEEYGFVEGRDYVAVSRSPVPGTGNRGAGIDYFLSLDMAKELGMVGGELRILDVELAARLGFARPRDIRKLVDRWRAELDKLGVRHTVWRVVSGNEVEEFYLNRKQAIFITGKSDMGAW